MPDDTAHTFGTGGVHRLLGITPGERTPERAEVSMPLDARFLQEEGVLQGGLAAALADAACVYLLEGHLGGTHLTSVEFKVNFLGPGRPDAGPVHATGELVRLGRRLAVCRARLTQADRPLLEGLFTYLRLDGEAKSSPS